MPSGDHTGTPHLTWTDREFEDGDPVIIELSGCRHRYHSPLARTTFVGDPPDELQETADIVVEGLEAALDAAEPGVTCESVEKAWRDTIAQYGLEKEDRIGYSMGLGYPPDWGEHTASIRPGDETILEEDMTFHMIPGIWTDEIGMEISETFHVTSNGAETWPTSRDDCSRPDAAGRHDFPPLQTYTHEHDTIRGRDCIGRRPRLCIDHRPQATRASRDTCRRRSRRRRAAETPDAGSAGFGAPRARGRQRRGLHRLPSPARRRSRALQGRSTLPSRGQRGGVPGSRCG